MPRNRVNRPKTVSIKKQMIVSQENIRMVKR